MPLIFFQFVTTDAAESYTRFSDFPKATKLVFSRLPFVFITIGGCTESLIATSIAAFGPKILESQYYVPAGRAALLFGLVTVSVALFGNMLGKSIRVNGYEIPSATQSIFFFSNTDHKRKSHWQLFLFLFVASPFLVCFLFLAFSLL